MGTYSNITGAINSSVCVQCPIGMTTTAKGSVSCLCDVGWYSDGPMCIQCPEGKFGIAINSNSCEECLEGSYSSTLASLSCKNCSAGTFNNKRGMNSSLACSACLPGTFNMNTGLSACLPCSSGTYSTGTGSLHSGSCMNCLPGTFSNTTGLSACTNCSIGKFGTGLGYRFDSNCSNCGVGTFGSLSGLTMCTKCPTGTFSGITGISSEAMCQSCLAGSYADQTGNSVCVQCPAGSFTNKTGEIVCTGGCRSGQYSTSTGMSSSSSCLTCKSGSFSAYGAVNLNFNLPLISSCSFSPSNSSTAIFSVNSASNSKTITCSPAGTIQRLNCVPGQIETVLTIAAARAYAYNLDMSRFRNPYWMLRLYACDYDENFSPSIAITTTNYFSYCDTTRVLDFPGGNPNNNDYNLFFAKKVFMHFSRMAGDCDSEDILSFLNFDKAWEITYTAYIQPNIPVSACMLCPRGTYSPSTASERCLLCDTGKYNMQEGQNSSTVCSLCPPGQYSIDEGRHLCALCDPGTYQKGDLCVACEPGTFANTAGSQACTSCPIGTYTSSSRSSACLSCSEGMYNLNLKSIGCHGCNYGKYRNVSQNACEWCPIGTFGSKFKINACDVCPAGTYSSALGSTFCIDCPPNSWCSQGIANACPSGTYVLASNVPSSSFCQTPHNGCEGDVAAGTQYFAKTILKSTTNRGNTVVPFSFANMITALSSDLPSGYTSGTLANKVFYVRTVLWDSRSAPTGWPADITNQNSILNQSDSDRYFGILGNSHRYASNQNFMQWAKISCSSTCVCSIVSSGRLGDYGSNIIVSAGANCAGSWQVTNGWSTGNPHEQYLFFAAGTPVSCSNCYSQNKYYLNHRCNTCQAQSSFCPDYQKASTCQPCKKCPPEALFSRGSCSSNSGNFIDDVNCACPGGTWYDSTHNLCVPCIKCPANAQALMSCAPDSTSDTTICQCNAGYYGYAQQSCIKCPNCTRNQAPDRVCGPHIRRFSPEPKCLCLVGAVGYGCCTKGQYCPLTEATPLNCAVGRYTPEDNMVACLHCTSDQYQNRTGQIQCLACPSGKSSASTNGVSCV